jgi:hypothetical protein
MAATLFGEAAVSRSRSGGVVDLIYIFSGTDDDADVMTATLSNAPSTHNGLERQDNDIQIEPLDCQRRLRLVDGARPIFRRSVGLSDRHRQLHLRHQRRHIPHDPQPRGLNSYAAAGGTAPDIGTTNGGPIGQNGEGVDVFVPKDEWEETHIFSWGDIDEHPRHVKELTARTNDASWRGHDEGEVIFPRRPRRPAAGQHRRDHLPIRGREKRDRSPGRRHRTHLGEGMGIRRRAL